MAQHGPPYGQPGQPGPVAPKPNYTGLLIGLGCGALALLVGACVLVFYLYTRSDKAKAALTPAPLPVPTEEGVPQAPPAPTSDNVSPPAKSPPTVPLTELPQHSNPACVKAEACCTAMVKALPPAQQNLESCLAMRRLPDDRCMKMYQSFQQSARTLGVTCD